MNTYSRGSIHFPLPGSRQAPRTFKGRYNEVKTFVAHYERLCAQYSVSSARERLDNIGQYCARSTREFMEALDSFRDGDWDQFVLDLLEYYDAERDEKRYTWRDLEAYAKKSGRTTTKVNLAYWKNYTRGFIRIGGWLSNRNKISEREQALYFWKGIPRSFRHKLESRLIATHPDHDMEEPFDIEDIQRASKSLLKRNRFDSDKLWSDDEQDDSDQDSDAEEPSDSDEESDSGYPAPRHTRFARHERFHRAAPPHVKKETKKADAEPKSAMPPSRPVSRNGARASDREVEDIIGKLNRMSLDDPAYAIHYFRAYQLNPIIADIVQKPIDRTRNSRPPHFPMCPDFDPKRGPPQGSPGTNAFQQPGFTGRFCYGCGGNTHSIAACAIINDLVSKGIVKRDNIGKLIMADGSRIYRLNGESFESAIKRLAPVQSHFITTQTYHIQDPAPEEYHCDYLESEESDYNPDTFIATRTQYANKDKRKEFQDTFPSARKNHESRHPRFSGDSVRKENIPPKAIPKSDPPKPPKPVAVDPPRFDPNDSDAFMEDDSVPPIRRTPITVKDFRKDNEDGQVVVKRIPRKSEVQSQVDQMNVLGRILSQPVTLAVGEVFGISKELTHHLQDVLKPKSQAPAQISPPKPLTTSNAKVNSIADDQFVATMFVSKSRGTLIKLRMECDGAPVQAIIDTGSQLNIAHKQIWKSILGWPIDMHRVVSMSDANGWEDMLKGLVVNVPLSCGGVMIHVNKQKLLNSSMDTNLQSSITRYCTYPTPCPIHNR